jgi:hypothetical protein
MNASYRAATWKQDLADTVPFAEVLDEDGDFAAY